MNSLFLYVIDKQKIRALLMHSDADVDRSLSRDRCWTFRSQSSVFHFLESLGFDPQSFHVTIDGIKTRQYCSRANVFFFSGSSHLGKNYQRKSFIKYHKRKKSQTYTLYLFRGQILENKKTPEGVYAGRVGGRKNYRYVQWQWIRKLSSVCNKCVQERLRCSVKD